MGTTLTSVTGANALPSALHVQGPMWSQRLPWQWTLLLPHCVEEQNEAQSCHLTTKTAEPRLNPVVTRSLGMPLRGLSPGASFTHRDLAVPWGPSGATPPHAAGSHPGHVMGYTRGWGGGRVLCPIRDWHRARDKKEAWAGQGVVAIRSFGSGGRKANLEAGVRGTAP